ncbi:MAG: ABC transporter ATP-binding protein [Candidatus Krumholzibacteriia bacterium]
MASVSLRGVSKQFPGGQRAVANVDLEIADGEFVVLVGPSGCGKSTTLRMIAGLETASTGEIAIGDRVVNDVEPKDRDIAMVFQSYALYPHMTVRENLAFGLKLRKTPREEVAARVMAAARTLGLEDYLERRPAALSGGQRQRVALGRALVREPKVFLFDEPLSNLDAKMRVQMRTEISRLHRRLGATMIYVTHDQTEAMTMGQRIVVMDRGEVQQVDAPLALYARPANRFVAGFIGSPAMNFLDGALARNGGLCFVAAGDGPSVRVPLPATWQPAGSAGVDALLGRALTLGVRPEHLRAEPVGTPGSFAATVQVVEPLGNEALLYLSVAGRLFVVRAPGDAAFGVDDEVGIVAGAEHLHLFEAAGGQSRLAPAGA